MAAKVGEILLQNWFLDRCDSICIAAGHWHLFVFQTYYDRLIHLVKHTKLDRKTDKEQRNNKINTLLSSENNHKCDTINKKTGVCLIQ